MPFAVLVDRVGLNGIPVGRPIVTAVSSQEAGLAMMHEHAASEHAEEGRFLFGLYDNRGELLLFYLSKNRTLTPIASSAKLLNLFAP